jgi:hypothetical protein
MVDERRRSARVWGNLRVAIEGVDLVPKTVRANLSMNGICFERDQNPGEKGTIEHLYISAEGGSRAVRVLGQLLRFSVVTDPETGARRSMVAFELMPDSASVVAGLRQLFQSIVAERSGERVVSMVNNIPQVATVFRLQVSRMHVETSWPVSVGDKVQVSFQSLAGGARIPFEGIATSTSRTSEGTHISEFELGVVGQRAAMPVASAHESITDSLDLLFTGDLQSRDKKPRQHLVGRLDRIPISTLFALFELERMSGELWVSSGQRSFTLFWSKGALVDVDPARPEQVRTILAELIYWRDGTFRFTMGEIERADRVRAPVTALLLDFAREQDEAGR